MKQVFQRKLYGYLFLEQVQEYVCRHDGHCLITYTDRRLCNCCRLAKCFRVGMKKSLILSDEERQARNQLVETNRLKRGKMPKEQKVRRVYI